MFSVYVSILLYASYGIMFYGFNTLWLKLWFKGLKLMDLFGYDTLVYIYIFKMFFSILCLVYLYPCLCSFCGFVPMLLL